MDEKPDQIIGHIEAKRDELGRNLSELEDKVRRSADWRTHFDKNPMLILGAALGGGLLVGSMVGGSRSSRSHTKGIRPWKPTSSSTGKSSPTTGSSSYYTPASESTPASFGGFSGVSAPSISKAASTQMHQVSEALDHIKGALIAFGIAKTKEFLSQAVPGLENHLGEFASKAKSQTKDEPQAKPYSTGSSADYRSGSQNYPGGSGSQGSSAGSPAVPNPSGATNTGRASEADEYAGAGRTSGGSGLNNTPSPVKL